MWTCTLFRSSQDDGIFQQWVFAGCGGSRAVLLCCCLQSSHMARPAQHWPEWRRFFPWGLRLWDHMTASQWVLSRNHKVTVSIPKNDTHWLCSYDAVFTHFTAFYTWFQTSELELTNNPTLTYRMKTKASKKSQICLPEISRCRKQSCRSVKGKCCHTRRAGSFTSPLCGPTLTDSSVYLL